MRLSRRSGLTQPTSLRFILRTLAIIMPLADDGTVLNSSLPLWLGHFSNLKGFFSFFI